jgi:hypothetical protein
MLQMPKPRDSVTEVAGADLSDSRDRQKTDFLTPTARARKNHPGQDIKAEECETRNQLQGLLAQERMRQNYLTVFSNRSLMVFHPEPAASNFHRYSPKTFRGFAIKLMNAGAKFNECTDFENTYMDQCILGGTFLTCFLHAILSDKICEMRLQDVESGSVTHIWDGESGILKNLYPYANCR